jgi:hypothetical protein
VLTVLSFTILTLAGPGCSVHYDILLNNGATVTAFSKPKPDGQGLLRFKNEAGEEVAVKEIRVIEIRAK